MGEQDFNVQSSLIQELANEFQAMLLENFSDFTTETDLIKENNKIIMDELRASFMK